MDLLPHLTLRRLGAYDTGRRHFLPGARQMAKFAVSMGARSFTIRFLTSVPDAEYVDFTKPEILELIQTLGTAHLLMPDGTPYKPFSSEDVDLGDTVETSWRLEIAPLLKIATIYFDHPCFGPLSFMIGRETAESMMQQLSLFVDTPQSDKELN